MCTFLVYFSKDFKDSGKTGGFAVGTGAGGRGGLCVGSAADSEHSVKPRGMNSFFSSLGESTKKQEVIDSKLRSFTLQL